MTSEIVPFAIPTRWNPTGIAAPIGRYSHLAAAPAGHSLVFVSGQVGNEPDGSLAGEGAAAQTGRAFANIEAILADLGAGPGDLLKLFTLVAGEEHLDGFYRARNSVFASWYPEGDVPAHSLAVVVALADPSLLVEIEAVVAVPAQ